MFRYNRGDFDQFYSIKFWWPVVFRYSRFWCPIIFRYTRRDPSSCSRLKSTTGTALSSGAIKVKLVCLLGQFQHLNSTYLYLDFHLRSMAKLKEQSREICYNTSSGGRPGLESWHNHNPSRLQWLQVEHHIYYPYIIHIFYIYYHNSSCLQWLEVRAPHIILFYVGSSNEDAFMKVSDCQKDYFACL